MQTLLEARRHAEQARAWFQEAHADSPLSSVAYFSMEFMLTEALPIYSGGLGNVAGDQLKAAGDLGAPVIGAERGIRQSVAGRHSAKSERAGGVFMHMDAVRRWPLAGEARWGRWPCLSS